MSDENCPNIKTCPMFPKFTHEGTLAVFKMNYCETATFDRCARYQLFLSGERPDDKLLPNGRRLGES